MKFVYRVNIRNQCYFLKNLYKNIMIDLFLQQKNESSGPSTSGRRRSQHERVRRTANRQEGEQHVRLSSNDDSAGQNSGISFPFISLLLVLLSQGIFKTSLNQDSDIGIAAK